MKQKEREPGIWKTWLLAAAHQLCAWGRVDFSSDCWSMTTLNDLNSELRKLEGISEPFKEACGNVLHRPQFSRTRKLASKSLAHRESDRCRSRRTGPARQLEW